MEANGLNLTVSGLTSITSGTIQNSGASDTLTFSGGLNFNNVTQKLLISTGLGTAVLGADVAMGTAGFLTSQPTIAGNLDLGGANRTFTIIANSELDITALISNGGLFKDGPGRLFLSHANSYAGGTVINGGSTEERHRQ